MRVLIAGATGVLGRRVATLLVAAGHVVGGITRTAHGGDMLTGLGVQALVGDVYDEDWLIDVTTDFAPTAMVNELTDLPDDAAEVANHRAANARIRRIGTAHLLRAGNAAGTSRFITQSVAWVIEGDGGLAVEEMERMVLAAEGVVVRYGQLYGPGTYYPDRLPEPPRVHVDDAATRTIPALAMPSQVLTIVDHASGAQ